MNNKIINNYFFTLFSIIPISIIIGSAVSLINILIIDISFLLLIIFNRDYSFLKNSKIKYLFILYLYLIFNSFISLDYEVGLLRNLGFIRFIILFVAFNYFFNKSLFLNKLFKVWLIIISIIIFDIF